MSEDNPVQPLRKPNEIHVTVDSEQMKQLLKQNDQLLKEKQELESQVAESEESKLLLNDLKEKASTELTALGIDTLPEDLKSKADLDRAVETITKLREKKKEFNPASGGVAPLPQSHGEKEGYGDYPSMISDLRLRANQGDANAKEALKKLTQKTLLGMRKVQVEPYQKPQTEQTTSSDLIENGKLVVKPDVLGLSRAFREKKLRAMAERGDQRALEILNSGNY